MTDNNFYFTNEILSKAEGRWQDILESLGIPSSTLTRKHGPCPMCGGKDRFRFDDKGKGSFYCNNCGAGHGIKFLMKYHGWKYSEALDRVARILRIRPSTYKKSKPKQITNYLPSTITQKLDSEKRLLNFKKIWEESEPIAPNDPVDQYFKNRNINLNLFPSTIRYHRNMDYYENKTLIAYYPCMIALVTDVNGNCVSLHRTYLDNGKKANVENPKKLMSPIYPGATTGASIKLFNPIDGRLVIAEGIETALAFNVATKISVWAAINANGMKKIKLPPHVNDVTILADNDDSKTGEIAANTLAKRLLSEGCKIKILTPSQAGYDFNDLLQEVKP